MAQDASKTAQDGLRRLNIGPHMTPSWLKMPRRCLQMTRNIRLDMDRLLLQAVYRHSEQSSRVQSSPVGIVRLEKQPSTNIEIDGQYWAPKLGPTMDPRWPTSHRFILSHRRCFEDGSRWLKTAQHASKMAHCSPVRCFEDGSRWLKTAQHAFEMRTTRTTRTTRAMRRTRKRTRTTINYVRLFPPSPLSSHGHRCPEIPEGLLKVPGGPREYIF